MNEWTESCVSWWPLPAWTLLSSSNSLGKPGQALSLAGLSSLSQSLSVLFLGFGITTAESVLKESSEMQPARMALKPKYVCFSEKGI